MPPANRAAKRPPWRADLGGTGAYKPGEQRTDTFQLSNYGGDWGGGGIFNDPSNPILTSVISSENTTPGGGGGMRNYNSSPMLTDVTFSGNSAKDGGGMQNSSNSSPTLFNVIFSGNSAYRPGLGTWGGGMEDNVSSSTWNSGLGIDAGGNLESDHPGFEDADNGDLRLRKDSPAIDKGNTEEIRSRGVTTDLTGNRRICGENAESIVVDMGAYEFQTDYCLQE